MSVLTTHGAEVYRRTAIQSRTPLELVVMLYDGALRFASEARSAIERRDIAARRDAVSRALAIVSELQSVLDMQAGGALAESLDESYTFVTGQLMEASFKQDVRPIDEAVRVLSTLREAWVAVAAKAAVAG